MKNLKKQLIKNGIEIPYELDIDDILPYEVFIMIDMEPIKKGYYLMSNYTRVYSLKSGKFLRQRINCSTEYAEVSMQCIDGKSRKFNIHRLLMIIFCPNENAESLVVNHRDGNKLNNMLYNLEWATPKYNMEHASSHGLLNPQHGETHTFTKITTKKCIQICELLESRRYQNKKIAEIANVPITIVDSIVQGKAWKHISKNYDLSYDKERISKVFTFEELHKICKFFQDNEKDDDMSLRKYLINAMKGIDKPITESSLNLIRGLYKKERWKYIYRYYNY